MGLVHKLSSYTIQYMFSVLRFVVMIFVKLSKKVYRSFQPQDT